MGARDGFWAERLRRRKDDEDSGSTELAEVLPDVAYGLQAEKPVGPARLRERSAAGRRRGTPARQGACRRMGRLSGRGVD